MKENERFLSWNERILIGNGWRECFGKGRMLPFLLASGKCSAGLGVVRVCGDGAVVLVGVVVAGGCGWMGFEVGRGQKNPFEAYFSWLEKSTSGLKKLCAYFSHQTIDFYLKN